MPMGANSRIPLGFDPKVREKGTLFADVFQPLSSNMDGIAPDDTLMRDHIEMLLAVSLVKMAELAAEPGYETFLQGQRNKLSRTIKDPKALAKKMKMGRSRVPEDPA